MNDKEIRQFVKDRDEAVASMDVETFKKFYKKYQLKGVYGRPIPSDKIIEITMRKMAMHCTNISDDIKREAEEWLTSRGYSTDIIGVIKK